MQPLAGLVAGITIFPLSLFLYRLFLSFVLSFSPSHSLVIKLKVIIFYEREDREDRSRGGEEEEEQPPLNRQLLRRQQKHQLD